MKIKTSQKNCDLNVADFAHSPTDSGYRSWRKKMSAALIVEWVKMSGALNAEWVKMSGALTVALNCSLNSGAVRHNGSTPSCRLCEVGDNNRWKRDQCLYQQKILRSKKNNVLVSKWINDYRNIKKILLQ